MIAVFVGLVLRHLLTAGGGAAVAAGVLGADDAQAVSGALVTLAGVAWSYWQKRSTGQV